MRVLPSTLVEIKDLQNDAALQLCPSIYQEHIAKQFELRVLVLGEEVIAVKLDSQAHEHSRIDWRVDADHGKIHAEQYALDAGTTAQILALMRALNLAMGSLDLIVTPDGEIVFLEVNEQGQFLFLEQMCPQLAILPSVCKFLCKAAGITVDTNWPSFAQFVQSAEWQELLRQRRQ